MWKKNREAQMNKQFVVLIVVILTGWHEQLSFASMECSDEEDNAFSLNRQLACSSSLVSVPENESEEFILDEVRPLKRLKRLHKRKERNSAQGVNPATPEKQTDQKNQLYNLVRVHAPSGFVYKDDSDEDDESSEMNRSYGQPFPTSMTPLVTIGARIKMLANVYLRKVDQTANIFVPRYVLEVENSDGSTTEQPNFFRTPKNQICIFASGGLQNAWEKTVKHVQKMFFGAHVKIIRASWMEKHLRKDKGIERNFAEEYKGREDELHSEVYFDLFFRHFFVPSLEQQGEIVKKVTIYAFSWWEVCDDCYKMLAAHRNVLRGLQLSYKVAARRRYYHHYPENSVIEGYRVDISPEQEAWQRIWAKVLEYTKLFSQNEEQRELFWTRTKDGLELCKWLGQAFVENTVDSAERTAIPGKKGDILKYYQEMSDEQRKGLQGLLDYLREKNWDLSCWYKAIYPNPVQRKWKRYWQQVVIPHFGWEHIKSIRVEGERVHCQMCGNTNLIDLFQVFHPKFRVSDWFLKWSEEQRRSQASELNQREKKTPSESLPRHLQKKLKQSLFVGSECVKTLRLPREEIARWREKHPYKECESKWKELDERQAANECIEREERKFKRKKRRKRD